MRSEMEKTFPLTTAAFRTFLSKAEASAEVIRTPEKVIDADLDYAMIHKTRQGAQVIKVERNLLSVQPATI